MNDKITPYLLTKTPARLKAKEVMANYAEIMSTALYAIISQTGMNYFFEHGLGVLMKEAGIGESSEAAEKMKKEICANILTNAIHYLLEPNLERSCTYSNNFHSMATKTLKEMEDTIREARICQSGGNGCDCDKKMGDLAMRRYEADCFLKISKWLLKYERGAVDAFADYSEKLSTNQASADLIKKGIVEILNTKAEPSIVKH